jgi:4-hydroxy-tetrahydrodipicolinate synthase
MLTWHGVMPAITTPFKADLSVDHEFMARHVSWLIQSGCRGIVPLGSLGEGATLIFEEKVHVLTTCVKALNGKAPVVAGVSSLSTAEAVRLAKAAADAGCEGLMVLPPYVYSTDWREMKAHVESVIRATPLSCMLYNNPIAYRTDFLPEHVAELAHENANLHAVKESSGDIRRITALRTTLDDRLSIFVGVDDMIVEGIYAGATGWIAGLVNAFPKESVALFDFAIHDDVKKEAALYQWFLPLLRMDTVPKFVQLIKLAQEKVGMGSARVRPPRLELSESELAEAIAVIDYALARRPEVV